MPQEYPSPADAHRDVDVKDLYVPTDWIPISPGGEDLDPPLRALRADSACTVTVRTAGSGATTRSMKFLPGETRYGAIVAVTAVSAGEVEGGV